MVLSAIFLNISDCIIWKLHFLKKRKNIWIIQSETFKYKRFAYNLTEVHHIYHEILPRPPKTHHFGGKLDLETIWSSRSVYNIIFVWVQRYVHIKPPSFDFYMFPFDYVKEIVHNELFCLKHLLVETRGYVMGLCVHFQSSKKHFSSSWMDSNGISDVLKWLKQVNEFSSHYESIQTYEEGSSNRFNYYSVHAEAIQSSYVAYDPV